MHYVFYVRAQFISCPSDHYLRELVPNLEQELTAAEAWLVAQEREHECVCALEVCERECPEGRV